MQQMFASEYRRSQKQPTCWSCGEAGHIQRNCKKQATEGTLLQPTLSRTRETTSSRACGAKLGYLHKPLLRILKLKILKLVRYMDPRICLLLEVWRNTLAESPLILEATFPSSDQIFCLSRSRRASILWASQFKLLQEKRCPYRERVIST